MYEYKYGKIQEHALKFDLNVFVCVCDLNVFVYMNVYNRQSSPQQAPTKYKISTFILYIDELN